MEAEIGVIELPALEEPFTRIRAEYHAIQTPLVSVAIDGCPREVLVGLREHRVDVLDAIARIRMRR